MIYTVDFLEIAGKLNYVEIAKYLKDLGWNEVESYPNVKIFQIFSNKILYQADIPLDRKLRDYNSAMLRAVQQIAEFSNKSTEHVLLELLNPLSDIIRFQVKEGTDESGTIKVEDAIKLYENAKKIVTFASMDYLRPSQYHLGRPDSISQELIQNCRFGQTEIGSYIVSLVIPFTKLDEGKLVQMTLFNEEMDKSSSITRNVTDKIITSIQQVKETINNGTFNEMMLPKNEQEHPPPISANFLEALSSIGISKEDSEVDISIKWAPTVKDNRAEINSVSLTNDYYKPIETVVRMIKSKRANEKEFVGRVSKLQATPNAEKRTEGEATIVYLDPDSEKACTAKVLLQKEDYNMAIEAHEKGKPVKVTGKLSGQKSKTIDYRKFEVLESWK
ncbi:MAG: hypothetical protein ABSE15_00905 [Candidatus Bathyarchaeia archaeon]|jgi:hypothetical protein